MSTYTDHSLEVIRSGGLLAEQDLAYLAQCRDELQDTWAKTQIFRTETEMRVSVLDDVHFPTRAAKYWQAVREQSVFFEELVRLGFDHRRNELAIRKISEQLKGADDPFEAEALEIDLDEKLFARANIARVAAERVRELRQWSGIKAELDDGSFDTRDPGAHQLASYLERFKREALHIQPGSPTSEVINIVAQLQTAMRVASE